MADNSHSKENDYNRGHRAQKFETDYRNVHSTDAFMRHDGNDGPNRERNITDVPGSINSRENDVLAIENDNEQVVIELAKDNDKYETNKGNAPHIDGESEPNDKKLRLSVGDNNNDNNKKKNKDPSYTPGHVSTEEVIASVQGEGPSSVANSKPKMQIFGASSVSQDDDFAKGLGNVGAVDNVIEDDIIAHMVCYYYHFIHFFICFIYI